MSDFLFGAAALVVALTAVGLFRVLRGPTDADRMMAVQLLGTGGVAALLLAEARGTRGAVDVALTLALLAAFAGIAFVKGPFAADLDENSAERGADERRD
jgi:multicomponent Na+:H+ antiporter subunit F